MHERAPIALIGILVFAAALVPTTAGGTTAPVPQPDDCVVAAEPNDEAPEAQDLPAAEACVTADDHDGSQDVFNWTVGEAEAARRWTIEVSGIPGQAVTLQVYRVELDEAGIVLSAEQLVGADGGPGQGAALADLLWPAGEYVVGIGASGPGPYELTITPGAPTPAANDIEPNDTAEQATIVPGAFAVSGDRAGSADWFTWDIDAAAAGQLWQLDVRVPVTTSGNVHVVREDGIELINTAVNARGTFILRDIGLEAGRYDVYIDSAAGEPPAPYIIEATAQGPRADGQEFEPNDRADAALQIAPVVGSTTMSGRLATIGADTDFDVFRLVIDNAAAGRQMDLKLFWPGGSSRRLCISDAVGNTLQCGDDTHAIAFNDLVLAAGEYSIQVSGPPAPDDPYLLRIDLTNEATSGFEAEPNDTLALASSLDVTGENPSGSGRLAGQGGGPDSDVFGFTVTGEPQLWQVTATGPGVTRLDSLDAAGSNSMSVDADLAAGTATLYDVFLLPGDRSFRVTGNGGDYTIAAVPMGAPDPQAEHEPNNTFDYSQPIRLAEPRTGRLVQVGDTDAYRFSLQNDGHVVIHVVTAADAIVQLDLTSSNITLLSTVTATPGDDISYDAVLPPGDYALFLTPQTTSVEPYELTIEPVDPFTAPDDAEPNDTADAARPIPSDLVISGTLDASYRYGDADWYVIPAQDSAATATFDVTGDGATIELLLPATTDAPETIIEPTAGNDPRSYTADLPADAPVLLGVHGVGDYTVAVDPDGGSPVGGSASPVDLPVEIDFSACAQPVAAYWPDSQRIDCDIAVTNTGDNPLDISLDWATGHAAWTLEFDTDTIAVDPGQTAGVGAVVRIAPDAWADQTVLLSVRAANSEGAASSSIAIVPSRVEPPLNSEPYAPLPTELLGGLDVAWTGLGGAPVAVDESAAAEEAMLYDQITPVGSGWVGDATLLPAELTVDLAGDEPVPVVGFTLNPQGGSGLPTEQLRGFDLELSTDGHAFTDVFSGELNRLGIEQSFLLPEPVDARFARLRLRSSQGATAGYVNLGSFSVIARPGWSLSSESAGLEIAAPERGGHVADMQPAFGDYTQWNDIIIDDEYRQTVYLAEAQQSWVIGFHQNRAARLTSLTWTDPVGSDPAAQFGDVTVDVSVDGPVGPWLPAGTWTIDRSAGPSQFTFAEPTWARFVRLTAAVPGDVASDSGINVELPGAVRVFESPADETYRSILGEWGHYRPEAIFEQLSPPAAIELAPDAGDDADAATPLPLGDRITDTALVGQDEDWYRVQIPADQHALSVTLTGVPTVDVDVTMFDTAGGELAIESSTTSANEMTFTALVDAGAEYLIHVVEPPSSVVFAFDTSMSIGPYTPAVLQGLVRYSGDVETGQEMVNILPFGADLLLDDWTDEPYLLQAAITSYPQTATSSDAEGALMTSMDALSAQPGVKAVVLITDAQNAANPALWTALGSVQPRVYAVHVAGGPPLDQHLMQDWAAVNGGLYTYVRNQGDIDVAFDRAATILRRPSLYSMSAETAEPPAPPTTSTSTSTSTTTFPPVLVDGFVHVTPGPVVEGQPVAVGASASVAIILDTSGSMLQNDLAGVDRIDAARGALTTLVTQTIPAGANVSLRVFGDTPESCDTRLLVPQSPLDQPAMAGVIQSVPVVDGVKTPIGASLQQVAHDLGAAPGPKIVVLVTDGEETCGGDPAAAIQALIESGIDIHVNIVGFALDNEALKAQFQQWAQLGNGQYIDAGNQAELTAAVAAAVQPTFDIVDVNGVVIASGQVGGDPVAVPEGTYALEVRSEPPHHFDITVIGTQTLELPLP